MNIHEQIDRLLNRSMKAKLIAVVGLFALFVAFIGVVYYLGRRNGYAAAENYARKQITEAQRKTDLVVSDSAIRESSLRTEAAQFAVQNEILRAQTEAQAEILEQNDIRISGNAQQLTEIFTQRKKEYENIEATPSDIAFQRRAVCNDARRAGFRLSAKLCGN